MRCFLVYFITLLIEIKVHKYYNICMNNKDKKETDLSGLSREELEKKYVQLNTKYNSTIAKLNWYLEQYRLAMQKRYGKSSEKEIDGQINLSDLPLFNEAETFREPFNVENDLSKYSEAEKTLIYLFLIKRKKAGRNQLITYLL